MNKSGKYWWVKPTSVVVGTWAVVYGLVFEPSITGLAALVIFSIAMSVVLFIMAMGMGE